MPTPIFSVQFHFTALRRFLPAANNLPCQSMLALSTCRLGSFTLHSVSQRIHSHLRQSPGHAAAAPIIITRLFVNGHGKPEGPQLIAWQPTDGCNEIWGNRGTVFFLPTININTTRRKWFGGVVCYGLLWNICKINLLIFTFLLKMIICLCLFPLLLFASSILPLPLCMQPICCVFFRVIPALVSRIPAGIGQIVLNRNCRRSSDCPLPTVWWSN